MPKLVRHEEIAEIFCLDEHVKENLLYVEELDSFFFYREDYNYWEALTEFELENIVYQFLKKTQIDKGITNNLITDIIGLVRFDIFNRRRSSLSSYISFSDALFNTDTFEWEEPDRTKQSFQHIKTSKQAVLEQKGKTPLFTQLLETSLVKEGTKETDHDLIALLQEAFGYLLYTKNPKHVAFNLLGAGRNGKSVLLNILKALVGGDKFYIGFSLEDMGKDFNKCELIGKKLNICSEDESQIIRVDAFKAITSGDTITAQRKFQRAVTFKPSIKIILSTNDYLRFNKVDKALLMRLIIIPFYRVFESSEQIPLLDEKIIEKEIAGVFAWAMEGLERLKENNFVFTSPASSIKELSNFEEIISSTIEFIKERYTLVDVDQHAIPLAEVYTEYQVWSGESGRKPVSKIIFSKELQKINGLNMKNKWYEGRTQKCLGVTRI